MKWAHEELFGLLFAITFPTVMGFVVVVSIYVDGVSSKSLFMLATWLTATCFLWALPSILQGLGGDGAQLGKVGGRGPTPSGFHQVAALAVVVLLGVDTSHQSQMLHLFGRERQQLGEMNAGNRSRNRSKRTSGGGPRFRIPAFQLA